MHRDVAKEMPESLDDPDPAETLGVDAAVGRLLPTLERFLAFSGPDQVIADRERWLAALDHPLPSSGAGLETLLDELSEWVVPYGVRDAAPRILGIHHWPGNDGRDRCGPRRPGRWSLPLLSHLIQGCERIGVELEAVAAELETAQARLAESTRRRSRSGLRRSS